MFRIHALGGVSVVALQLALSAPASVAHAQSGEAVLPPVTVDAPQLQARRAAPKPVQSSAASGRGSRQAAAAPQRQLPVVVIETAGVGADASPGTPPIKQRYQLPQTSESVTASEIQEKINVVDSGDAVKYMPSLFVRKRNAGDTQPVLATRTTGLGASARSLVYADDILLSALIANNNTIGAPRWGLVAPEEIQRVDFLYGPFSAAYPGNSVGGVLLITTRMPEKLEITAKQTEALQTFDFYRTKNTYRTDQTSVSIGDRKGNFSYFISGNFQNSFSQPLAWVTTPSNLPAGVTGVIPQSGRVPGTRADVVGAGGLLHTEMANVKGKFAWDITPWVKATYIIGYWSNDARSRRRRPICKTPRAIRPSATSPASRQIITRSIKNTLRMRYRSSRTRKARSISICRLRGTIISKTSSGFPSACCRAAPPSRPTARLRAWTGPTGPMPTPGVSGGPATPMK